MDRLEFEFRNRSSFIHFKNEILTTILLIKNNNNNNNNDKNNDIRMPMSPCN
jgi:hypothetical protein